MITSTYYWITFGMGAYAYNVSTLENGQKTGTLTPGKYGKSEQEIQEMNV